MMPSTRHLYGFSAGLATICATIAAFLVQDRVYKISQTLSLSCLIHQKFLEFLESVQRVHFIAVIGGVVLIVMCFFYSIYRVELIAALAMLGNVTIFGTMLGALLATTRIVKFFYREVQTSNLIYIKDIIRLNSGAGIAIIVLDLLALCSSTFALCSSRTGLVETP